MRTVIGDSDYDEAAETTNFLLLYEKALGAKGKEIATTLGTVCEDDFRTLKGWFGGGSPRGLPFKIKVVDGVKGAEHDACASTEIYVGVIPGKPNKSPSYPLLMDAEVVEVLQAMVGHEWNCGYNNGEALSRVLALDLRPDGELGVTASTWLDKTPTARLYRENWIDTYDPSDTNDFSIGCSVLFLNWLRFVRGYKWEQIILAGARELARVYQHLTGQNDGWHRFITFIDDRYPPGKPSKVTTDNPFR
jgi:hypothetical protein